MEKLSSKTLKNKNFLHSEDKKENAYKGNNNKSPENKRKNLEDKNIKKKLPFSISDKNVVNNTHKKLKFSQKNKIIFTEFLKRTLIKKGDKELLLIQCLKKEPQTRTKDENNTVRNFLSSSKIVNALLKIQFFKQKNSNNILSSITNELKFTSFKEGQMLFKIGDSIDNFYIIYNGNVLIENLERYSIALSSRQYIKAIIDKYHTLYDYKDEYTLSENNNLFNFKKIIYDEDKRNYSEYILQKIIETNKDIVNIEEDEIKYLNLILLIIDIKNTLNNIFGSYNALLLLIRDYNYDYKKILYDMDYLKNNFFVHSVEINMKQIYKNIPELNPKLVEKYEKIIDNCNNYIFIFFRKGKTTRLQNLGECFGDITPDLKFNTLYESHLKRDYSATALEDTNLAYIPFQRLSDLLKIEKEDIKHGESKFLKNSFFFNNINSFTFTKKYLKYFIYEEVPYNNYLFEQGQKDKYIYFLKYGKYEIFCHKNIKNMLKMVSDISKNYVDELKKSEYIKLTRDISKNLRVFSFIKKEFLEDIPIKLFVINKCFALGIEALYNDIPYLYNAKVLSEKAGYYKIEYKYLLQLMKEVKNGNEILMNESNYHLELILDRMVNICNKKVKYINKGKNKNIFDDSDSHKINKNKGKIKIKVFNNKIKEFLKNKCNKKINNFDSNFFLTARNDESIIKKEKSKFKSYFLTELSRIENKNDNKIENKELGKTYNKYNNNILKDNKVKPNIVKSKSSSINHFYNKNNLMNYNNIEEKHTENKNINATLNKMSKFNPFQIKFEENLIKKLKNTLENELLFYYSTKDKPKRNVKTADTKIKTDKKEKKEISTIIKSNKKEKEISDNNSLYSNVILPYYNSSKNVHNNLEKLIPLELDEIPKKKRFSSRNKNINLYPLYFTKDNNYLTKDALTINMDNLMKKTLINEQYNKTFIINNINKFNDEEKNELNNSFNKTLYEYKNKTKGYRNFSGINNKLKINIESYGFKGKKYLINYKNDYNKTLYKTIKERVEDNLFMNGQTSSPKINKAYY